MQSENINELAAALAKAQAEMTHAEKGVDNTFFKSKYADLAACFDAARPHLAKHGLSVTQPVEVDENNRVWIVTHLLHSSGQWMNCRYPANPVKNDPQGLGSAVTYARRYSYCAMVGIAAAGEDDDGNAASNNNSHSPTANHAPAYRPSDPIRPHKDKYVIPAPVLEDGTLDFDAFAADLESVLDGASNLNDVSMYNRANAKTMKVMQTERPELFASIGEKFKEMSNALK